MMRELIKDLKLKKGSSFFIKTLGCRVNQSESEEIAFLLKSSGLKQVEDYSKAELGLINTCAVTKEAEAKTRKEVRKLVRSGVDVVVVLGCASDLLKADIERISSNGKAEIYFLNNVEKKALIDLLKKQTGEPEIPYSGLRTRAFLKIQDGCNQRCTYCIVPLLRGREESNPAEEIVRKVEIFRNIGVREVVLTGVHLGRYNAPDRSKFGLSALLRELMQIDDIRIRLSSIDVFEIDDELIETVAEFNPEICPHFHIPLQSGSNKILKLMKRPYTKESFLETVEKIKQKIFPVALSTDVMVGFPGETDNDFAQTLVVVKKAGFMRLHVFKYSQRPGTEAASFENQISEAAKKEREKVLLTLSSELEDGFKRSLNGTTATVLVEKTESGRSFGRTEFYVGAKINEELEKGKLYMVKIRYENGELLGEVVR